ncbi:hypothetical protein [Breznakiella homolactica]|uniref:Uncharacterized protein n=1 Tax=Breznakiella homolactica TaxID=2798577 RepID=A0A7T8BAM1_9SPIR|nr:hypothetical protein [Breznakiella homolactica]QQO09516.1 hypothetical protein JFL75_00935 [Breznakiella homolactica]
MKKLIFLVCISFFLFSCEDILYNDITLSNNCSWQVQANVTGSGSSPDSYQSIAPSGSYTFEDLDDGDYYIHVTSYTAPSAAARNNYFIKIEVTGSKTYTLNWDGSTYYVTYYE